MFNLIVVPLIKLVSSLIGIFIDPIITSLTSVFSVLSTVFGYILQFLQLGLTYFIFFCQLFMVPGGALVLFFSFLATIIVFNAVLWVARFKYCYI